MEYADRIKAKIKESDVEGRLSGLVDEGERLLSDSAARAGDFAHEHRGDVTAWLDKASETLNEKTEGKYADHVDRIRGVLLQGLELVADLRPGGEDAAAEPVEQPELKTPPQE